MNKGLKIFLIVMVEIAIIAGSVFVGSVLFDGPKTKCETEKKEESVKQDNQNEDNTLASIQKIYEEAYDLMYEEFMPSIAEMQDMEANDLTFKGRKINKEKLGEYFSEKRLKIILEKKIGSKVEKGDVLAYIHANDEEKGKQAVIEILEAYEISQEKLKRYLLIRKQIIHKAVNKKDVFKEILQKHLEEYHSLKYTLVYVPEMS